MSGLIRTDSGCWTSCATCANASRSRATTRLNVEEIVSALEDADLATISKVRGYERKFAHRPDVLEEVARVYHRRQASRPASAAPAYQPMSKTSVASPGGDQPRARAPAAIGR